MEFADLSMEWWSVDAGASVPQEQNLHINETLQKFKTASSVLREILYQGYGLQVCQFFLTNLQFADCRFERTAETTKEILKLNNELINLKNKIDIIEANTENLNLDDDVPPPHY